MTNALLAEVAQTSDRIVLIEDTSELQCRAPNLLALRTKDGVVSLSDLVRSSLRLRPDRILIGEVRRAEALDLLKAWGIGHPGGIGTIHAGTALGALRRLEQLIQEAVVTVPRALIAETINLIAVLTGRGRDRRERSEAPRVRRVRCASKEGAAISGYCLPDQTWFHEKASLVARVRRSLLSQIEIDLLREFKLSQSDKVSMFGYCKSFEALMARGYIVEVARSGPATRQFVTYRLTQQGAKVVAAMKGN